MTVDLTMRRRWVEAGVIVAVAVPFVFLGIGSVDFLDPDEGMYGSIAREMAESGDWITPRFNGVRFLSYPPLQFWLSALTTAALGPSEVAVRVWSALPCLGTALLIWRIGAMIYGSTAGLLSGIVFITSVGIFVYSRVAMSDLLLVLSVTLAMYGFVRHCTGAVDGRQSAVNSQRSTVLQSNSRQLGGVLFWLGIALGVLSKGLTGVIFPVMIVGLSVLVNGQRSTVNSQWGRGRAIDQLLLTIYSPLGWLLFLGFTVPWHVLAGWKNEGFFDFYILENQFLRFFGRRGVVEDDVQMGTLAFVVVTAVWLFPWSVFVPAAAWAEWRSWWAKRGERHTAAALPAVWASVVLLFFAASRSKLEYYGLPAFPALSLMVGAAWAEACGLDRQPSTVNGQWLIVNQGLRRSLAVATASCVVVGVGLLGFSHFLNPELLMAGFGQVNGYYRTLIDQGIGFPFGSIAPFVYFLNGVGIVLALGFPLAYLFFFRAPRASFALMVLISGAIAFQVYRLNFVLESHHSTRPVAQALLARVSLEDRIVHEGPLDYSAGLPFYTGRQILVLDATRGALDFGGRYQEDLFLEDAEFFGLWNGSGRIFLVTGLLGKDSIVDSLPPDRVFLIGKYGARKLYSNARPEAPQTSSK